MKTISPRHQSTSLPDLTGWLLDEALRELSAATPGCEITVIETTSSRSSFPVGLWRVLRFRELESSSDVRRYELLTAREQSRFNGPVTLE